MQREVVWMGRLRALDEGVSWMEGWFGRKGVLDEEVTGFPWMERSD